jgi:hypothetical protein
MRTVRTAKMENETADLCTTHPQSVAIGFLLARRTDGRRKRTGQCAASPCLNLYTMLCLVVDILPLIQFVFSAMSLERTAPHHCALK